MADPDFIYDPDDWKYTSHYSERVNLVEDLRTSGVKLFKTLVHGPDKFVASVPIAWDDDGDPEDWEWRWFDSKEDAEAATAKSRP